ncbi:MAG TPA: hypothetical protein VG962_04660 [Steroidobacteraceae bacterium]|nr:hypothetical protein [Steroidobacteraceae bacterium]
MFDIQNASCAGELTFRAGRKKAGIRVLTVTPLNRTGQLRDPH